MWILWGLAGLIAWTAVALVVAVVMGRSIKLADRRSPGTGRSADLTPGDILEGAGIARPVAARVRRRGIPLPPVGIALIVLALGLETSGFLVRLTGGTSEVTRLLSMDGPFSLPRMFIALLFAAAAVAAVAGAGRMPGRRVWWLAVGFVGAAIAAVKAGSTIHADALSALSDAAGNTGALLLSSAVAALVVGALGLLSRAERRDRRRLLSVLAFYAAASIGLSSVSSWVAGAYGGASSWAAGATFVEESGEALAAVAFLLAVLVGVAPRLVLPASWALRRTVDAHTLDVPEHSSGRTTAYGSTHG